MSKATGATAWKSIAKKASRILSIVLTVIFVLVILFNLICYVMRAAMGIPCPTIFGYGTAVVITSSMEPSIAANDLIVIREKEAYEMRDVVVYVSDDYCITHRIVALRTADDGTLMVTTQGDANNTPDREFPAEKIVGEVVLVIPCLGYLQAFFSHPLGFLLLTLLVGLLILIPEWLERYHRARNA